MSAGASPHTPAAVRTSQEGSSNDATALLALLMSGTASAHLGHPVSRGDELGSRIGATRVHAPRCHSQSACEAVRCSGPADSSRETEPWAAENRREEAERKDKEESQRRKKQKEPRQVREDHLQALGIARCLTGQLAEAGTSGREQTG